MKKIIFTLSILILSPSCLFGQRNNSYNNYSYFTQYPGTEQSIKEYLKNSKLDMIEGIWSYNIVMTVNGNSSKSENYQKVAIIKDKSNTNRDYIGIVLDGNKESMENAGTFKYAITSEFSRTAYSNIYIQKGYQGKIKIAGAPETENIKIDKDGVLRSSNSFTMKNGAKVSYDIYAIKLYPIFDPTETVTKNITVSGTGFLLTKNGIIATNHHVIEGANSINIEILKNDKVEIYKATIIEIDKVNDVALLKIDDTQFDTFPQIPYTIASSAQVGESAFTIGFPLNNILGKNIKVTNGIVSSKSGLQDDIRFYQITVPIQPGNSGGPLFNEEGNIIGITTSGLNGEMIGTNIENVNYAIKSNYLLLLAEMAGIKDQLPQKSKLVNKKLKEQIEILEDFVCIIHVQK
jgi:S1-C subfamily serine protease